MTTGTATGNALLGTPNNPLGTAGTGTANAVTAQNLGTTPLPTIGTSGAGTDWWAQTESALGGALSDAEGAISNLGGDAYNTARATLDSLWNDFAGVSSAAQSAAQSAWDLATQEGQQAWQYVAGLATNLQNSISDFFTWLENLPNELFKNVAQPFVKGLGILGMIAIVIAAGFVLLSENK